MNKRSPFAGIPFGILFIAFGAAIILVMNVMNPAVPDNAEQDGRMSWIIAAGVFIAVGLFIAIAPAVDAARNKGKPLKTKLYIIDYEKAVGISIIPFGGIMFLSSFFIMLSENFMWIPIMVVGAACVGSGIYKLVTFSKKQDEFDDFRRLGKKLTGRIVSTQLGSNVVHEKKSATPIIAECLAADPDTGEEKHFYSRRVICGGNVNISGMLVDIYVYPSGQYYVDLQSAHAETEKNGKKVHDFR